MTSHQTHLIIVSGAPGTGKTTLARRLSDELGVPNIGRDALKEVLLDTFGAADRAASSHLGAASYALLFTLLHSLVGKTLGVIAESNFNRGRSETELLPLVHQTNAVLLHCQTTRPEIERRIRARHNDDTRHPGHYDQDALPTVLDHLDRGIFEPLDLPIPIIRIDTTNGYTPSFTDVVTHIHALTSTDDPTN